MNYLTLGVATFLLTGCLTQMIEEQNKHLKEQQDEGPTPTPSMAQSGSLSLDVPEQFDFSSSYEVDIELSMEDPNGNPIAGQGVSLYSVPSSIEFWSDEFLGQASLVDRGRFNDLGEYQRRIELPGEVEKVLVQVEYIGLENKVLVTIEEGMIRHTFR